MKDAYISLRMEIPQTDAWAKAEKQGKEALTIQSGAGEVQCRFFYDFDQRPLSLKAPAQAGDTVRVTLRPHRLELWVNGEIQDEEWPAGQALYEMGDAISGNLPVWAENAEEERQELPAVTGRFVLTPEWRPDGQIFVGDCMPYENGGRYHVLYLKDRHHHQSKWGFGAHQWEHISTEDFVLWETHPMAVAITEPYEGSICTGSWIQKGETQYLFYTVRMADRSPARICRSVSRDGYHFEKDGRFAFSLSEKYDGPSARDPKLVIDGEGTYHMFLTTSLVKEGKGCLAHLVSRDLDTWEEKEKPIYVSEDQEQPECPDYIHFGPYYYLIYSLKGKAHYQYSQKPFEDWRIPENPIIPCSSVPKGAVWKEKIVFTGFRPQGGYGGGMVLKTAVQAENGELVFEEEMSLPENGKE